MRISDWSSYLCSSDLQHAFARQRTADEHLLAIHEGRGVARVDGKVVFVSGALPGESVLAKLSGRNRHFDEARTVQVLVASPDRVTPRRVHLDRKSTRLNSSH